VSSRAWLARSLRSRSGLLQWALLLGAVAFVVWIIVSHREELKTVLDLTPQIFALITVSCFATFALNGIEVQVLASLFDRRIPFNEGLLLGLLVSTLNYLPMKTGTMLNGVLLRARYRLSLSHFTALIAGSSVVHLWVGLSMAGIALLLGTPQHLGLGLLFLLGPSAVVASIVVWGRMRTTGKYEAHESRFVRAASRAVDGLGELFSSGKVLALDIAINVGLVTLWAARMYWSFKAIGVSASFGEVLTVTALGILASRLSVIPGGVGFREAGAAFGSAITGLSAAAGFAASVIERAVTLIWLLLVGVPATMYFLRLTGVGLDDAIGKPSPADAGGDDGDR
jgi:uncharacterized membrane protein YbhN (UPF0104 family)